MTTNSELIRAKILTFGLPVRPCGHEIDLATPLSEVDEPCEDCEKEKYNKKLQLTEKRN